MAWSTIGAGRFQIERTGTVLIASEVISLLKSCIIYRHELIKLKDYYLLFLMIQV